MKAPCLRRQLVLESPEVLTDGAGGYVHGWIPLGVLWAEVVPRSGRQIAHFGAPVSRMGYRITVRGAAMGSDQRPAAQQRFRDGDRIYTIEAVAEADPNGRFLVCFAQEEQVA